MTSQPPTTLTAAAEGLSAAPTPAQAGLLAFPVFATGLSLANNATIVSPPATGFGDALVARVPNAQEQRPPLADFTLDLDVPTLQFYGELDENTDVDEDQNNREDMGPGMRDENSLPPQETALLDMATPDAAAGAEGIRLFLETVEDIGLTVARELTHQGLLPWAAAAGMIGTVALEVGRPRASRDRRPVGTITDAGADRVLW